MKHSLVRLKAEDGRMVVVDLGPKRRLDDLNLRKGQRIRVTAYPATLDGRPILLANRVAVSGRGTRGAQFTTSAAPGGQQGRTFRGRITGFRQVPLRDAQGKRTQHALVRLELENGRVAVVDLGPKARLDDLKLRKGDQIQLAAVPGRIDGRPALIANKLRVRDETRTIQRTGARERQRDEKRFTVQGTVAGYRLLTIGAGGQQAALLTLQLDDGRSLLIDAGQYTPGELNLQRLDIGDRVVVTGHRETAGGQPVLIAENIRFREEGARGGPQGSPERRSRSRQSQD